MPPVYSVPASTSLLAEVNELSARANAGPRDKASDGTIGDRAHAQSSSDHNLDETGRTPHEDSDSVDEVHARDVDKTGPWPPGWSMGRIVGIIADRHRLGQDNRLQNIIYAGRIASRSWEWTWRAYGGANGHYEHAHFGFRYGSGPAPGNPEEVTKPWGLLAAWQAEQEEDVDDATIDKIADRVVEKLLKADVIGNPNPDDKVSGPTIQVKTALKLAARAGVVADQAR